MALVANHEMDVCRAEWVSVHHLQELSGRTIVRDLGYVSSLFERPTGNVALTG